MIEGVKVKRLTRHVDDRGYVMEILRDDDPIFMKFGQVYVSACHPGIVKAWHAHQKQYDHFCVVSGNAKVGLYDGREGSPTHGQTESVVLGELNPVVLQIPPGVWHGMMALGNERCLLVNVPTEHYNRADPDELRKDAYTDEIPFTWEVKGR